MNIQYFDITLAQGLTFRNWFFPPASLVRNFLHGNEGLIPEVFRGTAQMPYPLKIRVTVPEKMASAPATTRQFILSSD